MQGLFQQTVRQRHHAVIADNLIVWMAGDGGYHDAQAAQDIEGDKGFRFFEARSQQ